LAHRDAVMLEDIDCFAGHLVVSERAGGLPRLNVTDLAGGESHSIAFPEPVYSAYPHVNAEFETTRFRFGYESFVTPRSVFEYDFVTRERVLLKQTEVLGGYDASRYASERIHATAPDGTRIPVSLLFKKDAPRDGSAPLLLTGYGAYGMALPIMFASNRFSLVDRGMVVAVAHVRGGGELGKIWHEQGRMMLKRNTFADFIAAAEFLIAEGWTRPGRLAISGGSAGGLLIGAVVNLRPDLFRAAVAQVPFVDVMNTMLDAALPLTVGEYLEWGNPNAKDAYLYIKSYSPYDNLAARPYPAMLVKTSLADSQVMYWEAAKYVAKLRALATGGNLLLLKTNMEAGHGGASGRYDALRETAFDYAFILSQVGIAA
jgi:oligopeptidase B